MPESGGHARARVDEMTTHTWSLLTDGQSIAFDPLNDVLNFDDAAIPFGSSWYAEMAETRMPAAARDLPLQQRVQDQRPVGVEHALRVAGRTGGVAHGGGGALVRIRQVACERRTRRSAGCAPGPSLLTTAGHP